jgi:glycosyltransferase involved in cell wall biosynthesis
MQILHITPAYYPATYWGGPIFSVYALNNALAKLPNIDLKVLTTDSAGSKVTDRLNVEKLDNQLFPNQEVIFTRRIAGACISIRLLMRLLPMVYSADLVHLTATYSFPTIPTILACRLLNKPLVWSTRGAILDDDNWMCLRKKRLKSIWLKICNAIILKDRVCLHVTSKEEKIASLNRIPKAEAVIITNGVDIPRSLPKHEWLPDGTMRLLFMGRLAPKKGIENLLEAMKLLENDFSINLTVCGTGDEKYEASLLRQADKLKLSKSRVHFVGHVNGEEKSAAFLNADVCVVPSHSENFCMVVAEALSNGIPTIASHGTPWSEIEKQKCGMWVGNSPESLVDAINEIRKYDLAMTGQRGREWMKQRYSWQAVGEKMHSVYVSILSKESSDEV